MFDCHAPLAVSHVLVDCPHFDEARHNHQVHSVLSYVVVMITITFLMFLLFKYNRDCHVSLADTFLC
jgi:hypothetical protein